MCVRKFRTRHELVCSVIECTSLMALFLILLSCGHGMHARANAIRYLRDLGVRHHGVSCSFESDQGHAYSSCEISMPPGTVAIDCEWYMGGKCRGWKGDVKRNYICVEKGNGSD